MDDQVITTRQKSHPTDAVTITTRESDSCLHHSTPSVCHANCVANVRKVSSGPCGSTPSVNDNPNSSNDDKPWNSKNSHLHVIVDDDDNDDNNINHQSTSRTSAKLDQNKTPNVPENLSIANGNLSDVYYHTDNMEFSMLDDPAEATDEEDWASIGADALWDRTNFSGPRDYHALSQLHTAHFRVSMRSFSLSSSVVKSQSITSPRIAGSSSSTSSRSSFAQPNYCCCLIGNEFIDKLDIKNDQGSHNTSMVNLSSAGSTSTQYIDPTRNSRVCSQCKLPLDMTINGSHSTNLANCISGNSSEPVGIFNKATTSYSTGLNSTATLDSSQIRRSSKSNHPSPGSQSSVADLAVVAAAAAVVAGENITSSPTQCKVAIDGTNVSGRIGSTSSQDGMALRSHGKAYTSKMSPGITQVCPLEDSEERTAIEALLELGSR